MRPSSFCPMSVTYFSLPSDWFVFQKAGAPRNGDLWTYFDTEEWKTRIQPLLRSYFTKGARVESWAKDTSVWEQGGSHKWRMRTENQKLEGSELAKAWLSTSSLVSETALFCPIPTQAACDPSQFLPSVSSKDLPPLIRFIFRSVSGEGRRKLPSLHREKLRHRVERVVMYTLSCKPVVIVRVLS